MANADHLKRLRQGVDAWNAWKAKDASVRTGLSQADLSGADLSGADLSEANLSRANLSRANLSGARLYKANLSGANLSGANLSGANLTEANLTGADLRGSKAAARWSTWSTGPDPKLSTLHHQTEPSDANLSRANLSRAKLTNAIITNANLTTYSSKAYLTEANLFEASLRDADLSDADLGEADLGGADLSGANLSGANLSGANLSGASLSGADLTDANLSGANLSGTNLSRANLVEADFTDADLTGCRIYGISAWGLKLSGKTKQRNLVITNTNEPEITVDNIEVAQFIYLLLHNKNIRDVIDTITSKAVLILGRFTSERKVILDVLRDELRKHDLLPIIFDSSIPASRDVTETVKVLAGLARFVIADITEATEVRAELLYIVPDFPKLPVQPILLRGYNEYIGLRGHLKSYPWVLPTFEYDSQEELIARLDEVIRPAEDMALKLRGPQPG